MWFVWQKPGGKGQANRGDTSPGWWDELFSNIARFPGYFFE